MGVIFILSSQSTLPAVGFAWEDKLLHVVAYAGLGVLALGAFHGGLRDLLTPGATLGAVALTVAYGVVDELHQSTVSGRVASVSDAAADAVGAVVAIPIYLWIASRRTRRREIPAR
jgi:VanZ family protein